MVIFPRHSVSHQIAISDGHNCIYFRKRAAVAVLAIDRAIDRAYLLASSLSHSLVLLLFYTAPLFLIFPLPDSLAFRDRSITRVFQRVASCRVATRRRRVDGNGSAAAECDITDFAINAATRADNFP